MSVVLADTLETLGRPYESALAGHSDGYSLASITAGLARDAEQGVAREPTAEEPAHGVVFGNKSKSIRSRLAKAAEWVVPPDFPEKG